MTDKEELIKHNLQKAVDKELKRLKLEDDYDSDAEGFKREQAIMKADDLRDEWHESGMSLSDFYDDRGW